jgi:hypothetical protein
MDKERFLKSAPAYYALAIVVYFDQAGQQQSFKDAIQDYYTIHDEETGDSFAYLGLDDLFAEGARHAEQNGLIEVIHDDFGPSLYRLRDGVWQRWDELAKDSSSLQSKYRAAGDNARRWLDSALASIKRRYEDLDIDPADFDQDRSNLEWHPIPLERDDPNLQTAIKEIDTLVEGLRQDNGYGITIPEEKTFVLEALRGVSKRLKEDSQISWMYLREFAAKPILIVLRRFGNSALGILATAARAALTQWLKSKGISLLDDIFR